VLDWLDGLAPKLRDKFIVRTERLAEAERSAEARGRPASGRYLRTRVRSLGVNYRILYFFHGPYAVLCRGLTKSDQVPDTDIERPSPSARLSRRSTEAHL